MVAKYFHSLPCGHSIGLMSPAMTGQYRLQITFVWYWFMFVWWSVTAGAFPCAAGYEH